MRTLLLLNKIVHHLWRDATTSRDTIEARIVSLLMVWPIHAAREIDGHRGSRDIKEESWRQ